MGRTYYMLLSGLERIASILGAGRVMHLHKHGTYVEQYGQVFYPFTASCDKEAMVVEEILYCDYEGCFGFRLTSSIQVGVAHQAPQEQLLEIKAR